MQMAKYHRYILKQLAELEAPTALEESSITVFAALETDGCLRTKGDLR